jgi:hypothetical protein
MRYPQRKRLFNRPKAGFLSPAEVALWYHTVNQIRNKKLQKRVYLPKARIVFQELETV